MRGFAPQTPQDIFGQKVTAEEKLEELRNALLQSLADDTDKDD